jgi:hypothetical protein
MKRLALLLAVLAAACVAPPAAGAAVVELGSLEGVTPGCPDPSTCYAIGRVTGYQVRAGRKRNPFRATQRGKIVAFSLALGKPDEEQTEFFNSLYGSPSKVQLVVLRPGSKRRHRLIGRSEVFEVNDYFGSTPTFALQRPLTMRRGYVAAISVHTWIPSFAVGLPQTDAWRSSRDGENCDDVRTPAEQTRRGSLRTYGCLHRTARLLYSVTFVPDPPRVNRQKTTRR